MLARNECIEKFSSWWIAPAEDVEDGLGLIYFLIQHLRSFGA